MQSHSLGPPDLHQFFVLPKIMKTNPTLTKPSSQIAGVAGEYFVAAELSRRGFIASITMRNSPGIDILATNVKASRTVTIQCKTSRSSTKGWLLSEKAEGFSPKNHFYVFVRLGTATNHPTYHIVPSKVVAKYVATRHRAWLKGKKPDGGMRKDSVMRKFRDAENKYLDKWNLLGL